MYTYAKFLRVQLISFQRHLNPHVTSLNNVPHLPSPSGCPGPHKLYPSDTFLHLTRSSVTCCLTQCTNCGHRAPFLFFAWLEIPR